MLFGVDWNGDRSENSSGSVLVDESSLTFLVVDVF